MDEIFYFIAEDQKLVYWTDVMPDSPNGLIFLGSSLNPNKKMAIQGFLQNHPQAWGWKIEELLMN